MSKRDWWHSRSDQCFKRASKTKMVVILWDRIVVGLQHHFPVCDVMTIKKGAAFFPTADTREPTYAWTGMHQT